MLQNLPAWKAYIIANINSCNNQLQLEVCEEFIHLFNLKYRGWISSYDLVGHNIEMHEALEQKKEQLKVAA